MRGSEAPGYRVTYQAEGTRAERFERSLRRLFPGVELHEQRFEGLTRYGDPIRIHVIGANSEQNGMFGVEGHEWPIEPYMPGADMISVVEYAGSEVLDVFIRGGAGGPYRQTGDFVWSNNRLPYAQSGQWGYLRVLPTGDSRLQPLGAAGAGAKRADAEPAMKAIPTAMK